jgi:undecaprenyl diphosphate synthase
MDNELKQVPTSLGLIMDGNRRWAREQGKPTLEGHRAGLDRAKEAVRWAHDAGIQEVILYAFSSENWSRAEEEVSYLMKLLEIAFEKWFDQFVQDGSKLRFIGDRGRLSESLQKLMQEAEERSAGGTKGTLAIALSYGGRPEILTAVNELLLEGREQVTEEELRAHMWTAGLADPDLIIRTGGEKRLSNFLLWQSAYSELFFTDTKWPAFTKEEFDSILEDYAARERRNGK